MSETFGTRLRRRREQQGNTIRAIADDTKISASLFEALERDDVSRWPTGLFRRAYFRAYAAAIGLDVESSLREFLALYPDPGAAPDDPLEPAGDAASGAPPSRFRMMFDRFARALLGPREGGEQDAASPQDAADFEAAYDASAAASFDDLPAMPLSRQRSEQGEPPPPVDSGAPEETTAATSGIPDPVSSEADRAAEEETVVTPQAVGAPRRFVDAIELVDASDGAATDSETRPSIAAAREVGAPGLSEVAELCAGFGRAGGPDDVQAMLQQAAGLMEASGLIVWAWDRSAGVLRPALACGYSRRTLAKLPPVEPDAGNPTAQAFRSVSMLAVSDETHGALVVPLAAAKGCAGVLALELPLGREHEPWVHALATIVASLVVLVTNEPASVGAPPPLVTGRHRPPRHVARRRSSVAYR